MHSPTGPELTMLKDREERSNDKYKSFLNKSITSCANLMLSNALLSNKNQTKLTNNKSKVKTSCDHIPYGLRNMKNNTASVRELKPHLNLTSSMKL